MTSLTATPQRRGLITTGGKSGSLTFNLYLFIQEAYRPNFGCHILVKSQFFREKYRKSMLLEPRRGTLSVPKSHLKENFIPQLYNLSLQCSMTNLIILYLNVSSDRGSGRRPSHQLRPRRACCYIADEIWADFRRLQNTSSLPLSANSRCIWIDLD